MAFIKDSANRTPIVDNVFAIVEKAKRQKRSLERMPLSMRRLALYTVKMEH